MNTNPDQNQYRNLRANFRISDEFSCNLCMQKFTVGGSIIQCMHCGTFYHESCWEGNKGCNQPTCLKKEAKICPNCGLEIRDTALKCRHCGFYIHSGSTEQGPEQIDDDLNLFLRILAFLIPLAGLIIYISYSSSAPKKSKQACNATLWGIGIGILLRILVFIAS